MRIYSIRSEVLPTGLKTRLIRAKTSAQALAFAVKDFYTVEVATQDELIELATNGVKVETAAEASK